MPLHENLIERVGVDPELAEGPPIAGPSRCPDHFHVGTRTVDSGPKGQYNGPRPVCTVRRFPDAGALAEQPVTHRATRTTGSPLQSGRAVFLSGRSFTETLGLDGTELCPQPTHRPSLRQTSDLDLAQIKHQAVAG